MAQRSPRKPIPKSALQIELIRLLDHEDGVDAAKKIALPELESHPAVQARMANYARHQFREALIQALTEAIDCFDSDEAPYKFLRWHFALENEAKRQSAGKREEIAIELAGKKQREAYRRDQRSKVSGKINKRPLSLALDRLEKYLASLPVIQQSKLTSYNPTARSIHIGQLLIPDAISVASCDKQQSSTHELLLDFDGDLRPSRPDPEEWPLLNAQLLPVLEEEARQAVVKFENDPILDLVYVEHQPETAAGAQRYRIGVAESCYYHWAATANSLDRNLSSFPDLTERLGYTKLREAWRCDPASLADLTRLSAPAFIGVCVVVIAEKEIILLERRRDHHVANTAKGVPAHFMGEGMLPKDLDAGRYSPEQAARRGCYEELGIGHTHLTLIPTGLIIDTKRWQPLFCFVGECDLTIPQLTHCMENAPHRYETGYGEIAALLPWTARDDQTLAVLTGEDPTFSLASNHAQAAMLNALYYADGRQEVNKRLGVEGKH